MSSKDYWKNREEEHLRQNKLDEAEYDKRIRKIYGSMLNGVQSQINAFYGKYASAEGITLAEAKKRISKADMKQLERKAQQYVKAAELDRKASGGITDYSGKYFSSQANDRMRLYNATMKINRLEMLKAELGMALVDGHQELDEYMEKLLQGRTEDELKRMAGILGTTIRNNAETANNIVNASFHNATFSDRIWMHQDLLKADIDKLLQQGLIQGKNPRALAKELEKRFAVTSTNAERLMRTELARVQTDAQVKSFIKNGFDEYTFNALGSCCDLCKPLDGKHFKLADIVIGENAPPIHPNCRCAISAYMDDAAYEAWLDHMANGGEEVDWKTFRKQNSFAKSVTLPKALLETTKMPEDIKQEISRVVDKINSEYDVQIENIEFAPFYDNPKAPFTFIPCNNGGQYSAKLNVNSLFDWNSSLAEFNDRIYNKNYKKGVLAGKCAEDLILHEAAHFMTFQDCQTYTDFLLKEREIRRRFIAGVSIYSDLTEDGAETIAEGLVRIKNDEAVSEEVVKLVAAHTRKRKQAVRKKDEEK